MRSFLLFINKQYETEEGEPCTLGEHLEYIGDYMGTPDCWSSVEGSKWDAHKEARESGLDIYIVDELLMRVIGHEGGE